MFATGRPSGNAEMNSLVDIVLGAALETGTIKARKGAGRVDISTKLVKAFGEGKGNIEPFLSVLGHEMFGADFNKATSYVVNGEQRTIKPMEDMFTYISKQYNEYKGSAAQDLKRSMYTSKRVPVAEQNKIINHLLTGNDTNAATAFLAGLRGTAEGNANLASQITMGLTNAETITAGAKRAWGAATKHIPGPMLMGLFGAAAAFSVMGGPGYSSEPLMPEGEQVNPSLLGAIKQGSLLQGNSVQPELMSFHEQGGGPHVTGQLSTPQAVIAPMTHQVSIDVPRRDMTNIDYNGISKTLRTQLPNGNISSRIRDFRRPMTPNDLYRDGY
jgi:hypothetical protein